MVLQAWVAPDWDESKSNVRLLDETRIIVVTRGSKEHLELSEARTGRERIEYTATKRESYEQIGKKFGLGKRDVARINKKPPDTVVEAGETIVIYRVVDHTRSDRAEKQWKQMPKAEKKKAGKGKGTGKRADADEADEAPAQEASPPDDHSAKTAAAVVEQADDADGPVTSPE
jgi:hypothetical protein